MSSPAPPAPSVERGSGASVVAYPHLVADHQPQPLDQIRLAASRCTDCGRHEFPARLVCPTCLGPTAPVGLGTGAVLAGWTSVLHPPPGAMVSTPYHVGVARFPEGIAVLGLLSEIDGVELGDALEVVAVPFDGDRLTYGFRPGGSGKSDRR